MTVVRKDKSKKSYGVKDGLYKRGKSWYIRVMVNGVLYRKSIGPEKARAEAVLAEILKQRALFRVSGELSGVSDFFKKKDRRTFREMAKLYLEERPHLKASTLRGYREILSNYLLPSFGNTFVDQITEEHIARFQAEVSKRVSATRVNNIMGPLRYVLKTCKRRKLITENPVENIPVLREEEPQIDPLSADELELALSACKSFQRPLFTCLAWTGARPDELFALRWQDVDFDRNEIRITKGRVRGTESTPKTRAGNRVIYMLSIVKDTLALLKKNPTQHMEGYVFLNRRGQPYDKHVDREWRLALKKAEVRHRPSYQLRHTFASLCLQNGLQPTWVAKMLGHSTPQITFKHYARFINDASNFNESRLEEFIESRQKTLVEEQLANKG